MINNYIMDQSPRITMTLSEILANTPPAQTLAQTTDVPGTNLEWMKTAAYPTGAWYGDLGELGTTGFRDSLFTGYLARGVTCKVSGVPYSWGGAGWVDARSDAARALATAYTSEATTSELHGYRNEVRSGLPLAGDTPTISASATLPSADADAATQEINIANSDEWIVDYLSDAQKDNIAKWYRGWNRNLKASLFGDSLRLSSTLFKTSENGNQDQDSNVEAGASWGVSSGVAILDFWLDSDVVFLRSFGGASAIFELYVDGNLCTNATFGTNAQIDASGRMIQPTANGYVKVKFPTVKRRRVTLIYQSSLAARSIHTRAIGSITPINNVPTWLHFGDSFSQCTISDIDTSKNVPGLGLVSWMRSMFGSSCNLINVAIGGTSLSNPDQILPSTQMPYIAGKLPSNRKVLRTITGGLDADIITCLFGHNDADLYASAEFEDEFRAFVRDVRTIHPRAMLVIFGSDASPVIIANGNAVNVEIKMKSFCTELGVHFIPLQTGDMLVLRGTGNQGNQTGDGNTDVYTGPDNNHPTAKGHRDAYGLYMARKLYEVLANI